MLEQPRSERRTMTTSSPEDAPRGMEFLYSLNRLNVATSRAQALVIVVGSPRLLEPECRSPRQMQLANALCRYVEMTQVVEMPSSTGAAPAIGCQGFSLPFSRKLEFA